MGVARQDGGRASRLAGIRGPGVAAHGVTHLEGTEQTVVKFQLQGRARQPGFIRLGGWVLRVDGKWPQTAGPLLSQGVDQLQGEQLLLPVHRTGPDTKILDGDQVLKSPGLRLVSHHGKHQGKLVMAGGDVIIYPVEVALQEVALGGTDTRQLCAGKTGNIQQANDTVVA